MPSVSASCLGVALPLPSSSTRIVNSTGRSLKGVPMWRWKTRREATSASVSR